MVFEYAQLRGTLDGMETTVIRDIADFFEKDIGYKIPPSTPFVGSNFNITQAGIHADGMLKDEEIYNIFDTTSLLKSPPGVSITQTSGQAGIAMWLSNYLKEDIDKNDQRVVKLKEWVDAQYDGGRITTIGFEELEQVSMELKVI